MPLFNNPLILFELALKLFYLQCILESKRLTISAFVSSLNILYSRPSILLSLKKKFSLLFSQFKSTWLFFVEIYIFLILIIIQNFIWCIIKIIFSFVIIIYYMHAIIYIIIFIFFSALLKIFLYIWNPKDLSTLLL